MHSGFMQSSHERLKSVTKEELENARLEYIESLAGFHPRARRSPSGSKCPVMDAAYLRANREMNGMRSISPYESVIDYNPLRWVSTVRWYIKSNFVLDRIFMFGNLCWLLMLITQYYFFPLGIQNTLFSKNAYAEAVLISPKDGKWAITTDRIWLPLKLNFFSKIPTLQFIRQKKNTLT